MVPFVLNGKTHERDLPPFMLDGKVHQRDLPHLLGAGPLVPEALWRGAAWQTVLMHIPDIVRGALLLLEPVEVAAQVHGDEEELCFRTVLYPALHKMLVQQLHAE